VKILAVCDYGINRSKHIAHLLSEHETKYMGVRTPPKNAQEIIDWADIVICATEDIKNRFREKYDVSIPVYHLNVDFTGSGFKEEIGKQLNDINFKNDKN